MKSTAVLEIHFLEQNIESSTKPPTKFNLTLLKNGNYTLSKYSDHCNLNITMIDWKQNIGGLQNLDEHYNKFLESKKKILHENLKDNFNFGFEPILIQEEENIDDIYIIFDSGDEEARINCQNNCFKKQVFLGCADGNLYEYSLQNRTILQYFGNIFYGNIESMATTVDKKYLFLCDEFYNFKEFDLDSEKEVKNFGISQATFVVVTYDNQFLLTALVEGTIKKWSIETKK